MTSSARLSERTSETRPREPLTGEPAGARAPSSRRAPTWPRVAVVAALLVLTVIVSRTCQQSEIELTQEEAVALATEQVRFEPENTQIRLLRQGLDRHPFWIVSLSIAESRRTSASTQLAVVRIDATSGEVVEVNQQRDQRVGARTPTTRRRGSPDGAGLT